MTIYELDEILSLKNLEKIYTELERHGFRKYGEIGKWEYDMNILYEQSAYCESASQKTDSSDKEYYATLYRDNKVYKGMTFIYLTLFEMLREEKDIPVPRKSMLFTDAPYDEVHIKEINSYRRCDRCGNKFAKKRLLDNEGKLICIDCLMKEQDEINIKLLVDELVKRKFKI